LPPRLFQNDIFRTATAGATVVAMVMFGATMLLPIFLQLVDGMSAGRSGLMLAPLTGGSVVGAFSSGQIMRATGNYKRRPLVGLSLATLALTLLAFMTADTSEVGGSFGAAAPWSVLIIALTYKLAGSGTRALPESGLALLQGGPDAFAKLSPTLRATLVPALAGAFHVVFAAAAVLNLIAPGLAGLLREQPLRTTPSALGPRPTAERLSAD